MLSMFLAVCGFEKPAGASDESVPHEVGVVSAKDLRSPAKARGKFKQIQGPVVVIDGQRGAGKGTIGVGMPYDLLSLYQELRSAVGEAEAAAEKKEEKKPDAGEAQKKPKDAKGGAKDSAA